MEKRRILAVADMIHPYVYRDGFPEGLGQIDLVLGAGDLPGYYLEFIATRVPAPVVYVHGNHGEEKVKDYLGNMTPPGGVIDAHGRVLRVAGLIIAGWGGAPKYREHGEGQYTAGEVRRGLTRLAPRLALNRWRYGRPLDIFLTHAPPPGPHAGTDYAHRPCRFIGSFDARYRPRLHVHGHVHNYEGRKVEYLSDTGTRVINAYGYNIIEVEVERSVPNGRR
ncbi:MAG TPA: metallophosphoesterase [Deinococcales bacterium]|nr:metallophosphoesterase [Deinococcales bacterium]